jgi:hypothetical protein
MRGDKLPRRFVSLIQVNSADHGLQCVRKNVLACPAGILRLTF